MSRSEISRRRFLTTAIGAAGAAGMIRTDQSSLVPGSVETRSRIGNAFAESLIDRKALVFRHSPSIHKLDPPRRCRSATASLLSPRTSPDCKPFQLNMKT